MEILERINLDDATLLTAASFNQSDLDELLASVSAQPSFEPNPEDESKQGGLDTTKQELTECPECGARFKA